MLLRLIEKRELEISKVALAAVADQFLDYVNQLRQPEPRVLASFLVVAAKLLYIKSQALLPQPVVVPPHGGRRRCGAELVRRLEEYRADAGGRAAACASGKARAYAATPTRPRCPAGRFPGPPALGLEGVTLAQLVRLVHRRHAVGAAAGGAAAI